MKRIFTILFFSILFFQSGVILAQSQQYLHFDRQDDFVEVPAASKFISGSDQITMAGWFWCDELAYGQGMMAFRNGGTGDGEMYLIQLNNGEVECRMILNGVTYEVVAPPGSVLPERWQHWAWIYDGNRVTLLVDGVARGFAPAFNAGPFQSSDTPFAIGQHISPFNFYYGGRADEVSLWSKALTANEVKDMMDNELIGDEPGLELYYKFNQGVPGGDNTSISEVVSEVNSGDGANGILRNFALKGDVSNFLGDVDVSFQAISFPAIPNKLVNDGPFDLEAESSSGLDVSYEIISGPATVSGKTVTLNGTEGKVMVRATQPGDGTFDPAKEVEVGFDVLDPQTNVANVDIREPLSGEVAVPELGPIPLAAISTINFEDLFSVDKVEFVVDGETIAGSVGKNGHYTGWWTPPGYGTYTMEVISTNNYGATNSEMVTFDIVADVAGDRQVTAGDKVWLDVNNGRRTVEVELPTYVGAYNEIAARLEITCPPGGCDEWDRVSGVRMKGHNGEWYEIIRYITPYGIACGSSIDLTDFMGLLHGKVTFEFYLGTQGNGFEYTLNLNYKKGTPQYAYSSVEKLWTDTYDFGDPANKKPTETLNVKMQPGAKSGKLKLVSTGHGWGDNNTGNAAEFHNDTHVIKINGSNAFNQNNWYKCDPNPDGCSFQNGTWTFDRAGWCPGAIAQWFTYDLTPFVGSDLEMDYVFNPIYTDFCHPNNSSCISGVTCDDCNAGFNPHLIVASHLVSFGDAPMNNPLSGVDNVSQGLNFSIFPNPTSGNVNVNLEEDYKSLRLNVLNNLGQVIQRFTEENPTRSVEIELDNFAKGIYFLEINTERGRGMRKVIVE